jgi:hypothetical protein
MDIIKRIVTKTKTRVSSFSVFWRIFMRVHFRLDDVHISWRSVDEAIRRASKMITDHERFLTEVKRTSGEGLQSIRNEYKSLENFKRTLEADDKIIQQITNSYSEVLRNYPSADANGEMRIRIKELNHHWETLNATFQETLKNVREEISVCI